jgi:peptide deformylase
VPDEWIRQLGDPALRQPVAGAARCDGVLRAQLERMAAILQAAGGAGLAAPQVGILQRAFVFRLAVEESVRAIVNPRIVSVSDEQAEFLEGCLSFQAVLVRVARPAAVTVIGSDPDGHELRFDAEGIEASLMQHEIDHLDGVLTLDRAEPVERRRALSALAAAERGGLLADAA